MVLENCCSRVDARNVTAAELYRVLADLKSQENLEEAIFWSVPGKSGKWPRKIKPLHMDIWTQIFFISF